MPCTIFFVATGYAFSLEAIRQRDCKAVHPAGRDESGVCAFALFVFPLAKPLYFFRADAFLGGGGNIRTTPKKGPAYDKSFNRGALNGHFFLSRPYQAVA